MAASALINIRNFTTGFFEEMKKEYQGANVEAVAAFHRHEF